MFFRVLVSPQITFCIICELQLIDGENSGVFSHWFLQVLNSVLPFSGIGYHPKIETLSNQLFNLEGER